MRVAGKERRKARLDIDHARCRTGVGDELGGMEQRDGSRETCQFRDSGIARRSNSTRKASCIGLLKSVDTNSDGIEEGCSIG